MMINKKIKLLGNNDTKEKYRNQNRGGSETFSNKREENKVCRKKGPSWEEKGVGKTPFLKTGKMVTKTGLNIKEMIAFGKE